MKKYYFILLIGITALFNSCIHDFEEGNDFSFRTFNQRLINQWKLDGVWVNEIDSTGYYPYNYYTNPSNFRMILQRNYSANGNYRNLEFIYGKGGYSTGMWDFTPKGSKIEILNSWSAFGFLPYQGSSSRVGKVIFCKNNRLIIEATLDVPYERKVRMLYVAL